MIVESKIVVMCYRMNHIKFSLKGRKNQFDKGNKNKVKKETWKKMTDSIEYWLFTEVIY